MFTKPTEAGAAPRGGADQDVAVQDLSYELLRPRLLAQGQVLELPAGFGPPEPLNGIGASGAVYIRSGDADTNFNDDSDNEVSVGPTEGDLLRGLLEFDLSSIPATDQIDSVSLVLKTLSSTPGIGGSNTLNVHAYGFDFDEATATWNEPGDGDTPGGTLGTLLSTVTFDTTVTDQTVTFQDTPEFRAALEDALAGDGLLRLILTNAEETVGTHNFARFQDGTPFTPGNRPPELLVSHSVPEPSAASLGLLGLIGVLHLQRRKMCRARSTARRVLRPSYVQD